MGRESQPTGVGTVPEATEPTALSAHDRVVLACLRARGGRSTLVRLAQDVAARQQNEPPEAVSSAATRRTYRELAGRALVDLARRGLIEVCDQTGTVRLVE